MRTLVAPVSLFALAALTTVAVADPAAAPTSTPIQKPTIAPTTPRADETGRFTMTPAPGGFLRLDTRTGGVSFCSVADGAAQCRSSADERAALEAEIARLSDENAKLRAGGGAGVAAASPQVSGAPVLSGLPKDEDVDRALGILDKVVRAIVRITKEVDTESK